MLSVAVVLFACASAYGFYKLRQESDLAQYQSQAALWLVVSFEREYLKFDAMMSNYTLSEGRLLGEALLTQYDVLWSRIDLMTQGDHARPLQQVDSYRQIVPVAAQLVRDYENAVFTAVGEARPLPPQFIADFRAMASKWSRQTPPSLEPMSRRDSISRRVRIFGTTPPPTSSTTA